MPFYDNLKILRYAAGMLVSASSCYILVGKGSFSSIILQILASSWKFFLPKQIQSVIRTWNFSFIYLQKKSPNWNLTVKIIIYSHFIFCVYIVYFFLGGVLSKINRQICTIILAAVYHVIVETEAHIVTKKLTLDENPIQNKIKKRWCLCHYCCKMHVTEEKSGSIFTWKMFNVGT